MDNNQTGIDHWDTELALEIYGKYGGDIRKWEYMEYVIPPQQ